MASLPRPTSRPSNPPTGPLPSIPLPKHRQGSTASQASIAAAGVGPQSSGLPQPTPSRTTSTSSIPTTSSIPSAPSRQSHGIPTPTTPTATPNASALTPAKSLRKTTSHGSLPSPAPVAAPPATPAQTRPNSVRSVSSTIATATPRSSLRNSTLSTGPRTIPTLGSSRASGASTLVSPMEDNEVPSQAVSPNIGTSVDDSIAETSTIGDDTIDEAPRGRRMSKEPSHGKDKGHVTISVRVRPEAGSGGNNADGGEWMVEGRQSLISYRGKEGGEFSYDNVFTAHDKNAKVYDSSAKRLVRRVMEGYHGTVFAYGMTGTGKTFSMQGTATSPGVIPLAITDIFSFIRETPHREFLLRVSYLEIYNEKIHDLLAMSTGPGAQQPEEIKLREDSKRGVYATPLKEEIVQSPTQLLRVIARGDHARRTASTQFNARSSRSHAVVQIVVESRERNSGPAGGKDEEMKSNKRSAIVPGGVRVSTLSLIDLAGSERAAEDKERRAEGAHINKSLLTLGTVISKLSGKKDKSGNPTDKEGKHLPYRDSKLTRLLQSALSGNSLISILCTIQIGSSGSSAVAGTHTMETLNTLKFAARARNNIVSHAKKAEESHAHIGDAGSRALLDRYRLEIVELRKQLEDQKKNDNKEKEQEKEKEREKEMEKDMELEEEGRKTQEVEHEVRHEEQMLEMQLARTALKERIEHLNRLILSSKSIGVNAARNMSSFSLNQRSSQFSMAESYSGARSVRSSASTQTLDHSELRTRASQTSLNTLANRHTSTATTDPYPGDEEEDFDGEAGDGNASLEMQVKTLQSDLAEKNRYISQLEKRLTQARRTSRSRLSSSLIRNSLPYGGESGDFETAMAEKDQEIADLRARLDDKDRMLAALQSAARKRDTAGTDSSLDRSSNASPSPSSMSQGSRVNKHTSMESTTTNGTNGIPQRRASLNIGRSSTVSNPNGRGYVPSPASPVGKLMQFTGPMSPTQDIKRPQGVDEMTRLLDEMIRQKVEANASAAVNGNGDKRASRRQSLLDNTGPITSERSAGPPLSRSARGSSRYSTDPTKLSGWETDVARRRASMMAQNSSTMNGYTNGGSYSRGSSVSGTSRPGSQASSATAIPTGNRGSSSSAPETSTGSSSDTTETTPRPGDSATFNSVSASSSRPNTAVSTDDSLRPKGLGLQLKV